MNISAITKKISIKNARCAFVLSTFIDHNDLNENMAHVNVVRLLSDISRSNLIISIKYTLYTLHIIAALQQFSTVKEFDDPPNIFYW